MTLTKEQSELVLNVGNGDFGTMWHKALPFAQIIEETMNTLAERLIAADLPVLGDDRMAVVEAAVIEHVKACMREYNS